MRLMATLCVFLIACQSEINKKEETIPAIDYTLTADASHNKFSSAIEPVLKVKSGSVIKAILKEASDGQLQENSTVDDVKQLDFEPIHPLTGPVFVEGAEPGDVLAVTLHKIDLADWGWSAIVPGFGLLADQFPNAYYKSFKINKEKMTATFNDKITVPLRPFPGVVAVAPASDSLINTIPPRLNGGNLDDHNLTEGVTIYFPVQVKGALFSIGDSHAAQGAGEICGTAIEAPMTVIYQVKVIKGKQIKEVQYETDDVYAVSAYATTLDEAAKKASGYMVDYLVEYHSLSREEAYVLASIAADLKIAAVVDEPHVLVTMHIPKQIFNSN